VTGPRVEWAEHTADACLRVSADTLAELLVAAADAMIRFCVSGGEIAGSLRRQVRIEGHDLEELLVGWLGEINALISAEDLLTGAFTIEELRTGGPPPLSLRATIAGEPLDPARHALAIEIKAVTHHGCRVERRGERWSCQVIFDL
jgi:SHS2 domain-containing protein